MPMKLYKATVDLHRVIEFDVSAESDIDANNIALKLAQEMAPDSQPRRVALTYLGDYQVSVGTRITHRIFGPGTITHLQITSRKSDRIEFRATIDFDHSDTKVLHLPHQSVTPEELTVEKDDNPL